MINEVGRLSAVPLSVFIIISLFVYVKLSIVLYISLCCASLINAYQSVYTLPRHCHNGRRLNLLISVIGCQEALLPDSSGTMMKEALMTDYELLSLVIAIISLVVIVIKK